ncbi:Kinesin-like protein 6 [Wickerhamiella sorbophila]|uniref:Kinesin-like protein n=1 Tax=Wickerhamiella sorbophila TaxID=45607 RepID=A0A2T0FPF7_9ASCO|nr:Kinesin-like protein 6 [Wickerhamiella sorbophila]PRT56865.1 Kinesin-like protein 6 [Wickerhamiella sorbophila]
MATESSISVVVRVRPFNEKEKTRGGLSSQEVSPDGVTRWSLRQPHWVGTANRKIVDVVDERMLIFDPQNQNPLPNQQKAYNSRIREQRFVFDKVFDQDASQEEVYSATVRPLLETVLDGYNASVFAYGATGCGKTHTISGTTDQKGLIVLAMEDLFARIESLRDTKDVAISLSYLEIYNETLRDLLSDNQATLALREGSDKRMHVSNLTSYRPTSVAQVMELIFRGNEKRTISPTEANAVSSRSHAVLEIVVELSDKLQGLQEQKTYSSLTIIDLAGSERAASTKNSGKRLVEGANINRSLLALGNCINGLCDTRRRSHIPYRDSKLTRLLKFSLGGNCKTVMIACVAPSSSHYDETLNTLKYADRAKSIKTKVSRNLLTVDRHVQSYCRKISQQQEDIAALRNELARLKTGEGTTPEVLQAVQRLEQANQRFETARSDYASELQYQKMLHTRYELLHELWRKCSLYANEDFIQWATPRFEAKAEEIREENSSLDTKKYQDPLLKVADQERLQLRGVGTALFDTSCRSLLAANEAAIAKSAGEAVHDPAVQDFFLDLLAEFGIFRHPVTSSPIETPNKRSRTTLASLGRLRSSGKRLRHGDIPPQSPLERDISMQDLLSPTGNPPNYLSNP